MTPAPQTTSDLRSLVARRVGLKRRVALLGSDPVLVGTLEANGCTVLADPESLEALNNFGPQTVIAFDGFAHEGDGAANFLALAKAAPTAHLLFSFANAGSSSTLLRALIGQPTAPGLSEPQVRTWLRGAGLTVVSRDIVIGAHQPTGLAFDAEAQLRQLLEQLNPDAGAERLLILAQPGTEKDQLSREPGLLSVLLSAGNVTLALQATLASLVAQQQRPMQVVIATTAPVKEVDRLVRTQADRGTFALEVLSSTSTDFAARTNLALTRARGQYLAFLEAGDTVQPHHFRQSLQSLQRGTSAWVLARLQQPGTHPVVQSTFSLPRWLAAGAWARSTLLLDRDRLGPFPLTFAEGIGEAEPLFLARLSALFPGTIASGAPTVERPTPVSGLEPGGLAEAMKARPLRALGPVQLAGEAGWGDRLKRDLDRRLPSVASQLKRWLNVR